MIVKKPIGAVKIGNMVERLTVGRPVPDRVLSYWKSSKQYDALIKAGAIGEAEKKEPVEKSTQESKKKDGVFRPDQN